MSSLVDSLKNASDLLHLSQRKLPLSLDGLTDAEAASTLLDKPQDHGKVYDLIDEIQGAIHRGEPIDLDEDTYIAVVDAIKHAQTIGIDDRYMLLEKVFTLLARLDPDHPFQKKLADVVITFLWNDLPHPPATYLGKKYAYRAADGSYNNIQNPDMGKARTPYARSVQPKNPIPYSSLPDPSLLFDSLLKRDGSVPHPSGISSMLFAFANIIIHSLFKTDDRPNKSHMNNTTSYLDLSPLYGDSDALQRSVRVQDGRGLLYEDTFADNRLLMMPPSTPALLIVFSRNHNFIATKLLQINENKTIHDPRLLADDPAALMTQDDEIFNKARLINCGHFMNAILTDYIGAILGLPKEGNPWRLNPLETIRDVKHDLVERGQGNVVSVEFNLLYRWHATISQPDEAYTENLMRKLFPDKPWHALTPLDFRERLSQLRLGASAASQTGVNGTPAAVAPFIQPNLTGATTTTTANGTTHTRASTSSNGTLPYPPNGNAHTHTRSNTTHTHTNGHTTPPSTTSTTPTTPNPKVASPNTWTFAGLTRDPKTGRFDDDALANILHNATETPAQAFRARGTPEVMRVVEVIAIEQARSWGVCTLNEFRQFLGLKPYTSFEEWNPDPEISNAAQALYLHIDNLELYVGMQAEETKEPGPGCGLCPGYTVSRAILADAIALTRGDRFFTTDFTPYNLTAWGIQDCALDSKNANGAFGGGLGKLLLRNLPSNYTYNSVYGLFSFYTPKTMSGCLQTLGLTSQYDFERPKVAPTVVTVGTWRGVDSVLGDFATFKTVYTEAMQALTNGYGFFLAFDDPAKHMVDLKLMRTALFPDDKALPRYAAFYGETTTRLIEEKSFSLVGKASRSVDIVRDVLNLVPVHWISRHLAGIPLKTKTNPQGVHTEQEVYQFMEVVFTYIFLNVQPETGWFLKTNAQTVAAVIQTYVQGHIDALRSPSGILSRIKGAVLDWFSGEKDQEHDFLRALAASGRPSDVLSYSVFGVIVASTANFGQAAGMIVNFYLDKERATEREEIVKLAKQDTPEGNARLLGYILEAMRLDPQAPGIFRTATVDADVEEGNGVGPVHVEKGETIFVSLRNAGMDPTVFGPDPSVIDPTRPIAKYKLFGSGMHSCLGQWFVQATMPQVIRSVFSLKNIRRAPGHSGRLNRFQQTLYDDTPSWLYLDARGNITPWPASMLIQYDI